MTSVTAKTSSYSTVLLPCQSRLPRESCVRQMTSAATPDFQAKPMPFAAAEAIYGRMDGRRISRRMRPPGRPKTRAISTRPSSAARRPLSTLAQMTGRTVKKLMTEGMRSRVTHRNTRIVKDATGIARMSCRRGAVRTCTNSDFTESTARSVPTTNALKKPTVIRRMDRKTA